MKYRQDKYGNQISQLGYGCMRFTKKGGSTDYEKAESEVLRAIELGVNYFDTAYIYPGNEECLGKILANNHVREKINIATKLPQYMIKTKAAIDKTFEEELRRLRTDYIDYYLMHMFTDIQEWENIKALGIEDWIKEHKANGSIRQIGFSYHGDTDMFLKILDAYDWDFCQIQYNYMDEHSQAGRKGLMAAAKKGIPVIIMEPLRGGKLVNQLPEEALTLMKDSERAYSAAEWGLRWLWDQPEVTCILSGMNSMEMVEENIRIASEVEAGQFTESDFELIENVKSIIRQKEKVGCTGCRYCMPCPRNLGIRQEPVFASQCIGCGKCEKHCPQHINIREKLKEADRELRPLPYKIGIDIARRFMVGKR